MPVQLDLHDASAELFHEHRAKWHKSCHLQFAPSKLMKAQEQSEKKRRQEATPESRKSKRLATGVLNKELCIFCCEGRGKLHECATKKLDEDLRKMAIKLEDTAVLARISGGDLVAIEAKYHLDCLTRYRNRYRSAQNLPGCSYPSEQERLLQAIVFAELVANIEGDIEEGKYIFKLKDLHSLYESSLEDVGINKQINKTRLKESIIDNFPGECQEQFDGKTHCWFSTKGCKGFSMNKLRPVTLNLRPDQQLKSPKQPAETCLNGTDSNFKNNSPLIARRKAYYPD